jgi:hypothetical protein
MSESPKDHIQRLLREGLDLYGVDEVSAAIMTWQQVLKLDPQNREAADYLKTAERRKHPREPKPVAASGARADLLREARALMRQGDFAGAFGMLAGASGSGSPGLEFEATFDLARSRLFGSYCERVGALSNVPRVLGDATRLKGYNLPPNAGFVLSMIDGGTSLEDLISLLGMDPFEALHTVSGLLDAGLVEVSR